MSQIKTDLGRIRENQRRSRARRKEYLHELETKVRRCELQGVDAATEIQFAARRVAHENKKLRELLARYNVSNHQVEKYLESSQKDEMGTSDACEEDSAVDVLESLLLPRACGQSQLDASKPQSKSRVRNCRISSSLQESQGRIYREAAQRSKNVLGTTSPPTMKGSSGKPESDSEELRCHEEFKRSIQTKENTQNSSLSCARRQLDQHSPVESCIHSAPLQSMVNASDQAPNVNSCIYATDMITTMAGGDPSRVRADLGCSPAGDCEVDNNLVFHVMDRYASSGL